MHCRYMLVQLEQHRDMIKQAGLKAAALGLGQPKHAAHFGHRLAPSVLCLANETNGVHYSYGLKRNSGVDWMFKAGLYAASARAAASGVGQGAATGDIAMLGGVFVVDSGGVIQYAYVNDYAGDYPPVPNIIAAVQPSLAPRPRP